MNRFKNAILLIFTLLCGSIGYSQTEYRANTSKMYGEIGVTTNYVEKGITQSNKGPSLNAGLGYLFGPQARIGFQAASVTYPNESASVQMSLLGEYKFIFGAGQDLKVRNNFYRYFSESLRNKVQVNLDYTYVAHHILYMYEDNFEGTRGVRNWYGYSRDIAYSPTYKIPFTVGYSMASGYTSYFDTKVGFAYFSPNITAGVYNTFVSSSSQFGGQADIAFLAEVVAKF